MDDNKRYGYTLTIPVMRQKHVEQFIAERRKLSTDSTPAVINNGNTVRIAARMGWVVKTDKAAEGDDGVPVGTLKEDRVGDLYPYVIEWMAGEIADAYTGAFEAPGE